MIYQIVNAILVVFPQAVLLDPLEIYYSSHPNTPWKFAPLDSPPPLEPPVTFHGGVMDIFWNYTFEKEIGINLHASSGRLNG